MRKTPFKFVLHCLSQYSSVVSAKGILVGLMPAQLNTWSSLPNFSKMAEMNDFTSDSEPTSTFCVRSGTLGISEASVERAVVLMSQRAREAPRAANLTAVARLRERRVRDFVLDHASSMIQRSRWQTWFYAPNSTGRSGDEYDLILKFSGHFVAMVLILLSLC